MINKKVCCLANKDIGKIRGLPTFARTLFNADPKAYRRVKKFYEVRDDGAQKPKLLSVPNNNEKQRAKWLSEHLPVKKIAEERHLDLAGLDKYLLDIVGSSDSKRLVLEGKDPNNQKTGLPDYHQINVLNSFAHGHPLIKFINKPSPLFTEDYVSMIKSGFLDLHMLKQNSKKVACGVLEASAGESHNDDAWTRDMAAVGLGKVDTGEYKLAKLISKQLYRAYADPYQRHRIDELIKAGQDMVKELATENPNMDIVNAGNKLWKEGNQRDVVPQVKFHVKKILYTEAEVKALQEKALADGKTEPKVKVGDVRDYQLVPYEKDWGMKQIDAYGYLLNLMMKLTQLPAVSADEAAKKDNKGPLDIKAADERNKEIFKQEGQTFDSTLVALSRMLVAIKYWDVDDVGAWEDSPHHARTSSVAAALSGLQMVKEYFDNQSADKLPAVADLEGFRKELDIGIREGVKALFDHRIPLHENARNENAKEINLNDKGIQDENGQSARNHRDRHKDAALLFTLVLSDPNKIGGGLSKEQKNSILRTVYDLMGDVGFARFPNDEYMGQDWVMADSKHPNSQYHEHANNQDENYKPAEWCFFDPYLASYWYKESMNQENSEEERLQAYMRADRHARRSLAQVTKSNYEIQRQAFGEHYKDDNGKVTVPAGEVMEHYWLSTKDAETNKKREHATWMPGENYRLNWTKIALQQMVYNGAKAGKTFKKSYPNHWNQMKVSGLNFSLLGMKKRIEQILETTKERVQKATAA